MSKGLVIAVVAVAAASLLALAFVLGRESAPGVAAPTTRIERVTVAPRPRGEPLPQTTPSTRIMDRLEAMVTGPPPSSSPEQGAAPLAAAGQVNAGSDPERAAVAAYFDAVDRIQLGAMSGEADPIAHEMAASLVNGDTSGLEKMIRQTETVRSSLAAIMPPAPCAVFHRESLASLDDGVELLRTFKPAMESSDPGAQLAAVSNRAIAMRSRAEALQKEERALRERYGLKK